MERASMQFAPSLFKRSVLLVKIWANYTARIVGSCHGLLWTYALEVMTLYIMNCKMGTWKIDPEEVLRVFIEYFSSFDWSRQMITIWGVIPVSKDERGGLKRARKVEKYVITPSFLENIRFLLRILANLTNITPIPDKTFIYDRVNISDPVLPHNNLGHSVSASNFNRMKLAFNYSAHLLSQNGLAALFRYPTGISPYPSVSIGIEGESDLRWG